MMAGSCDKVTLEEAIKNKYCSDVPELNGSDLKYKSVAVPLERRSSLVLDHCGVTCVGDVSDLSSLCPNLAELHLASNSIVEWEDVCGILSSFSKLILLDLSHNPLHSLVAAAGNELELAGLTTLALNSTAIQWSVLQACLKMLPGLTELHLCKNDYVTVQFDPSFAHTNLKQLVMNENQISKWEELSKLSNAFPNLQKLVAIGIPLEEIPVIESPNETFPHLRSFNLNKCSLSEWSSVEHFGSLKELKELCLRNVPLGKDLDDKNRRYAIISRLPDLSVLNKSEVASSEREDAERWFIRQHSIDQHPPAVYHQLVKKHGELDQLVTVDMTPRLKANITFHFGGKIESHTVDLRQTTRQLKQWVGENFIGMPASTFVLYYHDHEYILFGGPEEMKQASKKLYTYSIKDNDQIHIEMKASSSQFS